MNDLFLSPPVVQNASPHGFTVSIEVSELCFGRVEWGTTAETLDQIAFLSDAGLIDANDRCLRIPVSCTPALPSSQKVYYRIVAEPVTYKTAYEILRGEPVATDVRSFTIPHPDQPSVSLVVLSDTHGFSEITSRLASRVDAISPDLLVLNGDLCNYLDPENHPASVLLRSGVDDRSPSSGGWASERPAIFVSGNHDVRGSLARERMRVLATEPDPALPFNQAFRVGPLAIVTLDTGEDKPDAHPAFGGMASYEPYRKQQADWLFRVLQRDDIRDATYKIAFAHIPLKGLEGENDGTILEGAAAYSGDGGRLWLSLLENTGFQAVISGHTHAWRCDGSPDDDSVVQIVGGGPLEKNAAVIVVHADADNLLIRVENIQGEALHTIRWST